MCRQSRQKNRIKCDSQKMTKSGDFPGKNAIRENAKKRRKMGSRGTHPKKREKTRFSGPRRAQKRVKKVPKSAKKCSKMAKNRVFGPKMPFFDKFGCFFGTRDTPKMTKNGQNLLRWRGFPLRLSILGVKKGQKTRIFLPHA